MFNGITKFSFRTLIADQFLFIETSIILFIFFNVITGFWNIIHNDSSENINLYKGYTYENKDSSKKTAMVESIKSSKLFEYKSSELNYDIVSDTDFFNSPVYTGKLKLVGIVKNSNQYDSMAIIAMEGKQKTYFYQDLIESENMLIIDFYIDRIIIKKNDEYSAIILE